MTNQPPPAWGGQPHQWQPQQPPPAWTEQSGPPGGSGQPQRSPGTNALAIVSLIAGIVWIFGFGSLVAVVTGAIALSQISKQGQSGRGMAIAGIALGAVGLLGAILIAILAAAVGEGAQEFGRSLNERHPVTVRVEAAPTTCWTGTFAGASREGCGNSEFSAQESFITTASFAKKSDYVKPDDTSALTLVLLVDGVERERRTTTVDGGSVSASATVVK